jgi:hypothetical protein
VCQKKSKDVLTYIKFVRFYETDFMDGSLLTKSLAKTPQIKTQTATIYLVMSA